MNADEVAASLLPITVVPKGQVKPGRLESLAEAAAALDSPGLEGAVLMRECAIADGPIMSAGWTMILETLHYVEIKHAGRTRRDFI